MISHIPFNVLWLIYSNLYIILLNWEYNLISWIIFQLPTDISPQLKQIILFYYFLQDWWALFLKMNTVFHMITHVMEVATKQSLQSYSFFVFATNSLMKWWQGLGPLRKDGCTQNLSNSPASTPTPLATASNPLPALKTQVQTPPSYLPPEVLWTASLYRNTQGILQFLKAWTQYLPETIAMTPVPST